MQVGHITATGGGDGRTHVLTSNSLKLREHPKASTYRGWLVNSQRQQVGQHPTGWSQPLKMQQWAIRSQVPGVCAARKEKVHRL